MRTIVNGSGINSLQGSTGLSVDGDLTVSGIDVVKELRELKQQIQQSEKDKEKSDCCADCKVAEKAMKEIEDLKEDFHKEIKSLKDKIKVLESSSEKKGKAKPVQDDEDK